MRIKVGMKVRTIHDRKIRTVIATAGFPVTQVWLRPGPSNSWWHPAKLQIINGGKNHV